MILKNVEHLVERGEVVPERVNGRKMRTALDVLNAGPLDLSA